MTSLYGNVGGAQKSITSAFGNIDGSQKQIFPMLYIWNKYTISTSEGYYERFDSGNYTVEVDDLYEGERYHYSIYTPISSGYIFYASTGEYRLGGSPTVKRVRASEDFVVVPANSYYIMETRLPEESAPPSNTTDSSVCRTEYDITVEKYSRRIYRFFYGPDYSFAGYGTIESQGSYISQVSSTSSSAYPSNGKHTDGYWYVYQGQS